MSENIRARFDSRLSAIEEAALDGEAARLVTRFQNGDNEAFGDLYRLYFDPIYGYLLVALRDHHRAEDLAQQVLASALEAMPRFKLIEGKPFRAWLFTIARNELLMQFRADEREEPEDPATIDRLREAPATDESEQRLRALLEWISDKDLLIFVQRLPQAQRQALTMRFVLDLTTAEIAQVLGRTEVAVRKLEHRALRFLEERLDAVRERREKRGSQDVQRDPMLVRIRRPPVVRARRFSLGSGPPKQDRQEAPSNRRYS